MKPLLATIAVAAALLTAAPPPAVADVYAGAELFATIENIKVIVADDVTGGCLLNARDIRARILATLERSGIAVSSASDWMFLVSLRGFQVRIEQGDVKRNAGCVLGTLFQLIRISSANTWTLVTQDNALKLGPDALDNVAMQNVEQFTDEVIATILAARRTVGASGVSGRRS
jgi:hypothetical protein